jgi:hypothetical protein
MTSELGESSILSRSEQFHASAGEFIRYSIT